MRPSKDQYFLQMAQLVATRSTCLRRSVGCVLTNKRSHVIATGYNGVAAETPHCNHMELQSDIMGNTERVYPHACKGSQSPSGTNLDGCQAIHAEQNALLQCRDVFAIETAYVTVSPCVPCAKLLLGTSCKRIVFLEEYPHTEARDMWEKKGRTWINFKII